MRPIEPRHAAELFALIERNRARLCEWLGWVDGTATLEDTRAFITSAMAQFARDDGFQLGVWLHGRLAGMIGFVGIDWGNRKTEIGYWLSEEAVGRGVMTSAARALTQYALVERGLNRVEIYCATGNRRSRAIPQRLGFRHEGTEREAGWLYDHFVDREIYAMLARDWREEHVREDEQDLTGRGTPAV